MSQTQSVRVRSQRTATAAVERARLSLVPNRPSSAPRAPFAILVFLILGAGVLGLLMFNTQMQQASFHATELQKKADALEARSQAMSVALEDKRDPQRLARAARKLNMVTPPNPATLNLSTGKIEGEPLAATPENRTIVQGARTPLPPWGKPKAIKKFIDPPAGQTSTANGPASGANTSAAGTNDSPTNADDGAQR